MRYPAANAPRTAAAMTMMTGTAMIMNNIRSRGESGDRPIEQQIIDGFDRTGLSGPASYLYRGYKGAKYGGGGFVPVITKMFGGPFVSDIADGIAYNTDPVTWLPQNTPGYSLMAPKDRRALNTFTKRYWASKTGASPNIVRSIKSKGGVVEDVLNVISEPDERKVRGQSNTYSGMAGVLFQDEEERGAFAEGGKVSITDTDEMYGYLTKDEDEYNVFIDKRPISIYTEETLPDLDIKETYYTGFKGNTVSDRLNSVRQSSTIGLPVTTDKKKARGVVRVAGKIKFGNVLKLNIDSATPEAVQAELNKNMDSLIKIEDKILGKEIIKAANDNLAIRDDVLNNDPDRTPEKEAVIAKSKSFLVRHQLLKLGYDAIETKEGYTLLRENQFLTTDIMERTKAYGGGLASKLNRRQQYNEGGESYGNVIAEDYKEELQGLKDMLTDPVGMIDSISQLGLGAIALAIPDKYQEQKLDQYEELAKGVGQSLVTNFGTLEKAKQTIIDNPVGTAATVSGLLFGGGLGLKKIADAAKASKVSQAGAKIIKASDVIDPIIGPILGAGKLITRRDFNTGVTGAALASAIPASKVLDEVKTVKKLTGINKFRNLSNIFKPHLLGSIKNKEINKKINDKMFNEIKRTRGEREAISYRMSSRKKFKEVDRDTQLKLTYELQDELLKISKQLDNAPDKKIFNYKLNESPIRIDPQHPVHRARKENWDVYTETKGDYGEKIKYNITVGTVEGIPVFKIGDTQAYDQVYIPNSIGLSKLAKQKNNITKRNLLTGLRDRNNKGGEVG